MPHWICDDCGAHLAGELKECPKCNESYGLSALMGNTQKSKDESNSEAIQKLVESLPIKVMEPEVWFNQHRFCRFKVEGIKDDSVLIRCVVCEENYLL